MREMPAERRRVHALQPPLARVQQQQTPRRRVHALQPPLARVQQQQTPRRRVHAALHVHAVPDKKTTRLGPTAIWFVCWLVCWLDKWLDKWLAEWLAGCGFGSSSLLSLKCNSRRLQKLSSSYRTMVNLICSQSLGQQKNAT